MNQQRVAPQKNRTYIVSLASALGLAGSLIAQHVAGLEPCTLCMLQRILLLGALLSSLPMISTHAPVRWASILATSGFSFAGLYWAIQQFDASTRASCGFSQTAMWIDSLGLDQHAPWFFEIRVSCAGALPQFLGLDVPMWSALTFLALIGLSWSCIPAKSR